MKKQILDALKAKFPGVSEQVLSRIADKLAKTATTDEQVATAVEGVTYQQIIDGEADRRATEATQTAVSNYEKKHGLKDGQKVQGGEPVIEPGKGDDETPAWAKNLIKTTEVLATKVQAMEGEKITANRKQKLDAIINKLPENLRKPYARTPVNELTDEEFDTLTGEIQTEVDGLVKEASAKGAVFGRPVGNGASQAGPKEASDAEAASVVDKMNI